MLQHTHSDDEVASAMELDSDDELLLDSDSDDGSDALPSSSSSMSSSSCSNAHSSDLDIAEDTYDIFCTSLDVDEDTARRREEELAEEADANDEYHDDSTNLFLPQEVLDDARLTAPFNAILPLLPSCSSVLTRGVKAVVDMLEHRNKMFQFTSIITNAAVGALDFLLSVARKQQADVRDKKRRYAPPGCSATLLLNIASDHLRRASVQAVSSASISTFVATVRTPDRIAMIQKKLADLLECCETFHCASQQAAAVLGIAQTEHRHSVPVLKVVGSDLWFQNLLQEANRAVERGRISTTPAEAVLRTLMPLLRGLNPRPDNRLHKYSPFRRQLRLYETQIDLYLEQLEDGDASESKLAEYEAEILREARWQTRVDPGEYELDSDEEPDSEDVDDENGEVADNSPMIGGLSRQRTEAALRRVRDLTSSQHAAVQKLHPRAALIILQHLLIALCQINKFEHATGFAELVVVVLREALDECPSVELQVRCINAFGALAVLLREEGHVKRALAALREAMRLADPLRSAQEGWRGAQIALVPFNRLLAEMALAMPDRERDGTLLGRAARDEVILGRATRAARDMALRYRSPPRTRWIDEFHWRRTRLAEFLRLHGALHFKLTGGRRAVCGLVQESVDLYEQVLKEAPHPVREDEEVKMGKARALRTLADLRVDGHLPALEALSASVTLFESARRWRLQGGTYELKEAYAEMGKRFARAQQWDAAERALEQGARGDEPMEEIELRAQIEWGLEHYASVQFTAVRAIQLTGIPLYPPQGELGIDDEAAKEIRAGVRCRMLTLTASARLLSGDGADAIITNLSETTIKFAQAELAYEHQVNWSGYALCIGWTGAALCKAGRYDEALEYGRRAVALAQLNASEAAMRASDGLPQGLTGRKRLQLKEAKRARSAAHLVREADVHGLHLARMLVLLGNSLLMAGHLSEAMRTTHEALRLITHSRVGIDPASRMTALLLIADTCEVAMRSGALPANETMQQAIEGPRRMLGLSDQKGYLQHLRPVGVPTVLTAPVSVATGE
ncbi:hypothetical protein OC844_000252 [Tilletia horrida]|nr:hypothetical protein OC844_000252 [Tilletia horrida]